jgi:hypothetical protein
MLLNTQIEKVRPVSIVDKNHFCRMAEDQASEDGIESGSNKVHFMRTNLTMLIT